MDMLTHNQIWSAIDLLAKRFDMSASGLAKKSGLDPTTFNPSKRQTASGRDRWPSTESIAKILKSTGTSVPDFMGLVISQDAPPETRSDDKDEDPWAARGIPVIGFAQAGAGGFFDDGGFPVGQGWDEVVPPSGASDSAYALKVSGDSMLPLYRAGDVIIVDPVAQVRAGDRVVAKTTDGEVFAKTLKKNTVERVELQSLNPDHDDLVFQLNELEWIARIVWASQ